MKLGVNTVLFKKFPVREAVLMAKRAGYDGVELSAIQGMCEHLVLDEWEKQKDELIALREETGMEFLSMEAATNDRARIEKAFAAAQALGIPLVNIGPGGSAAEGEESLQKQLWELGYLDREAVRGTEGQFGEATRDAVIAAQQAMQYVRADGVASPEFQAFLFSRYCGMIRK